MKPQKIDFSGPCKQGLIWARVSKKEQKAGVSTHAQIKDTTAYCHAKPFKIIKTFDVAESSTRGKRPEFHEMLDLVKAQTVKTAIVVHCIDRLQRGFKECAEIEELLKEDRIEVHFYKEGLVLDKNSPSSDIMRWDFGILGAKMYVGALRDNVKRSMNYNWDRGIWQGRAPVGYVNIPKTADKKPFIEIDTEEGRDDKVRRLFKEYAKGTHSLKTLGKLVKEMNLCVRGSKVPMKKNQIYRTLRNPFYCGTMLINGKLIDHIYDHLIDRPLFEAVQDVLDGKSRAPFKAGYGNYPFMFRGLIKCATCGCVISPEPHTKKSGKHYLYLKCNKGKGPCSQPHVNEVNILNQLDIEIFDKIRIPESSLDKLKKNVRDYLKQRSELDESTKRSLNLRIIENKETKDRLLDLYLKQKISENTFNTKDAELDKEATELNDMLTKYQTIDSSVIQKAERVVEFAASIGNLMKSSQVDMKRALLGLLLVNPLLKGTSLCFDLQKPFDSLVKIGQKEKWCG
ncbi:MAG: recombinase family protein [Alphaproteobacteria bacterium]|nr:recombinase family protein [Alphaproteobacteria bacterium]